ncbi:ATP-binding cassette domain-containing protein [Paracoccus pacificus]|uniref:ATP-binding cassette domain-containing protein n=1 Tax=Paracoccus pacificus TaxID=1463598 RepID=A0ABW4R9D5_9RHOB
MTGAPLLTIRDLSVIWPGTERPAVAGVSLDLRQGERLALIGESGSGKSTLARAIAGLLPPRTRLRGGLHWAGDTPRLGRDIGYVFQDPGGSLDPLLSIGAQLVETLRAHLPLDRAAARDRAQALLTQVRLPDPAAALAAYPHQFSGGQRQRIAIALAIAADPKLLIADEATSALDMLVQAEITALLRELSETRGMTLLFITHDIALAGGLADRIAVMRDAHLVEAGAARQVIDAPTEAYTRQLLAAHMDLNGPRLVGPAPEAVSA